jgi:hypothetical protein
MTNGQPGEIRRRHSTQVHIKRLLQSTSLAVALGSFLPLPMPVTGIVFDPAAYADPYTGAIPKWIRSACCGPGDVHRLAVGQLQEVDAAEALRLRPNADKDVVGKLDTYYVIHNYDYPLNSKSPSVRRVEPRSIRLGVLSRGRSAIGHILPLHSREYLTDGLPRSTILPSRATPRPTPS